MLYQQCYVLVCFLFMMTGTGTEWKEASYCSRAWGDSVQKRWPIHWGPLSPWSYWGSWGEKEQVTGPACLFLTFSFSNLVNYCNALLYLWDLGVWLLQVCIVVNYCNTKHWLLMYFQVCEADVQEQPSLRNHHSFRILNLRCDDLDDYLRKVSLAYVIFALRWQHL